MSNIRLIQTLKACDWKMLNARHILAIHMLLTTRERYDYAICIRKMSPGGFTFSIKDARGGMIVATDQFCEEVELMSS